MERLLATEQGRLMIGKHVISGLSEKRARIAGELSEAQIVVMRLRSDLAAIDCCIRMFKADFNPATVVPKVARGKSPAGLAKGVGTRTALGVLRTTGETLSSEELAYRVLILMNKETDVKSVAMLQKAIHSSFSRQKRPVVSLDRRTWPGKWRLLPP
jgi:hypothetical protein